MHIQSGLENTDQKNSKYEHFTKSEDSFSISKIPMPKIVRNYVLIF